MLENIIRFSRADGAKSPYLTFLNSPATTVSLMCRHTAAIGVFSMPSTQKRCFYKARKKVSILKPLTGHLQILRTDRRKNLSPSSWPVKLHLRTTKQHQYNVNIISRPAATGTGIGEGGKESRCNNRCPSKRKAAGRLGKGDSILCRL